MTLPLDLGLLESDKRFQEMCFYLARKEFPGAIPVAHGSWDGGRDIVLFANQSCDVVWQCKFTHRSLSELKPKIVESLRALDRSHRLAKWILCVSVDGSGIFLDWLRDTVAAECPFIAGWELGDKQQLLERLERYPDVLEMFFYPVWKALESRFRTEELELVRYGLDPVCGWMQVDPSVLHFVQIKGTDSDLVIDIIVRSRGTIQSLLRSVRLDIFDVRYHLRGLPGTGLLYSQHTYTISLRGGQPGSRVEWLEPPLLVDPGKHQRFSIKLTDSGYAWSGYIQITVLYGDDHELSLPSTFLTP
jgi:hypothetical protein